MSDFDNMRVRGAVALLRETWRDDGAEGESVHLVCRALDAAQRRVAALERALIQSRVGTRSPRMPRPRRVLQITARAAGAARR